MTRSPLTGTTWNITTNWQNVPPEHYLATFKDGGVMTISPADSSFTAHKNAQAIGYWTSNGQMVSFCVSVMANAATGAPNAVGGYAGVLASNKLAGNASGYVQMDSGLQPLPGSWSAVQVPQK